MSKPQTAQPAVTVPDAAREDAAGWLGARRTFAVDAALVARHQHRQCGAADAGRGLRGLVPAGAMGGACLPAGHHHADRQRGQARRHLRPPARHAGRHRGLHRGVAALRAGADAAAADRGAGGAGRRRRRDDGADHRPRALGRCPGKDRQRHGPARHHVGGGHGARALARRAAACRNRLAGDLPRQRAARHRRLLAGAENPASRPPPGRQASAPASTTSAPCSWRWGSAPMRWRRRPAAATSACSMRR